MQEETRGVTRWRRSVFLALPATVAVGAMATAMVQGALAANLSLTSVPFTLSSKTVAAPQGIGAVMHTVDAGGPKGSAEVGLAKAGLDGICVHAVQSVDLPVIGSLGTWSLNISSPAAATPLTSEQLVAGGGLQANKLVLDAQALKASTATLHAADGSPNVIGAAADSAGIKSTGINDGTAGQFGLDATGGRTDIKNLNADANAATISGAITLPDLAIGIAHGDKGC
ncbi:MULTISPECIES: cholesterol esterase [unclassified Streptomyces]|uniref:cholesterol esterase n=1 Tax=unclassified Streptomyces TaxID=2593676 RepID=UPI00339DAFDD